MEVGKMEKEKYKGYSIEIEQDDCDESPREWDNLGKMVCFHKRYNLGDKTDLKNSMFNSWDELEDYLVKGTTGKDHDEMLYLAEKDRALVILPLYLYDHSGLRMSVGSFNDRWDSGQVGFIYATREDILKCYMVKKISKSILKKVEVCLESEVKTYDQYLSGDVYHFLIEDKDGEQVDSCGGYYGYKECLTEAQLQVDWYVKKEIKSHEEKLKAQIKNKVDLQYRLPLGV
jgi:hypothetical protein